VPDTTGRTAELPAPAIPRSLPRRTLTARRALATVSLAALAVGLVGAYRYVDSYVLYRGFGPPHETVAPSLRGTLTSFTLHAPALGGAREHVLVYLPSGYARSRRRYPVVYLLHGTPGDPRTAYVNSLHVVPRMNALVAAHLVRPMVIVMPPGSPSTYDRATEWANGPGRSQAWFTYLTRDLVRAVDARYRVIRTGAGRGIGGYSSGADAALNAGLLRPGEYRVVEGWSGDYQQTPATVGRVPALVARFSARDTALTHAAGMRRAGDWAYIYGGRSDRTFPAVLQVAAALRRARVHLRFSADPGGHAWMLWSSRLPGALRYFSEHLA
jgi:enterochelin esterase-like enzyme